MAVTLARQLLDAAKEREATPPTENYNDRSSQRLLSIGNKKIRTTMIGCISEIEKTLGKLWGAGSIPYEEMTDEEKDWYELWQIARKNMLNLGNNQIRAFQNELNQYTITWNRHMSVLPIKNKE